MSPFSSLDLEFDFAVKVPDESLSIVINDIEKEHLLLTSSLSGNKIALTDKNLVYLTITNPLLTLKIISLIHWQALLLYFKRIPFFHQRSSSRETD